MRRASIGRTARRRRTMSRKFPTGRFRISNGLQRRRDGRHVKQRRHRVARPAGERRRRAMFAGVAVVALPNGRKSSPGLVRAERSPSVAMLCAAYRVCGHIAQSVDARAASDEAAPRRFVLLHVAPCSEDGRRAFWRRMWMPSRSMCARCILRAGSGCVNMTLAQML